MPASREMTLEEYMAQLPTSHRARKEYMALRSPAPGAEAMREAAAKAVCCYCANGTAPRDAKTGRHTLQETSWACDAIAIWRLPLPAREVPEAWTATKDAMPEKSRGLLAFCQGFKEHSGVSWRRTDPVLNMTRPLTPEQIDAALREGFASIPAMPTYGGYVNKPEPAPVGGDDEALLNVLDAIETKLASTEQYELAIGCQSVATRLRAALSDLARLEARPSRYEDLMAIEQLQVQVDHYRTGMTEARAALAAAVAEGDQFCRTLVDLYDAADETGQPWRRISVSNALIDGLRARAGRNDVG